MVKGPRSAKARQIAPAVSPIPCATQKLPLRWPSHRLLEWKSNRSQPPATRTSIGTVPGNYSGQWENRSTRQAVAVALIMANLMRPRLRCKRSGSAALAPDYAEAPKKGPGWPAGWPTGPFNREKMTCTRFGFLAAGMFRGRRLRFTVRQFTPPPNSSAPRLREASKPTSSWVAGCKCSCRAKSVRRCVADRGGPLKPRCNWPFVALPSACAASGLSWRRVVKGTTKALQCRKVAGAPAEKSE